MILDTLSAHIDTTPAPVLCAGVRFPAPRELAAADGRAAIHPGAACATRSLAIGCMCPSTASKDAAAKARGSRRIGATSTSSSHIEGHEEIGWKPLADCALTAVAYDAATDVTFFSDRPDSWLSLPAGHFAIFFPDDAHAPLAGRGTLKKAIVKIAVD